MKQPRAAADFAIIRTRMKELRRERERAEALKPRLTPEPPPRSPTGAMSVEISIRGRKKVGG